MALISIGVWLALDVIAHVWQHYFTQGPLEKLLKLWAQGKKTATQHIA